MLQVKPLQNQKYEQQNYLRHKLKTDSFINLYKLSILLTQQQY